MSPGPAPDRRGIAGLPASPVVLVLSDILCNGAGEAIRTPDPNLGKVVLYP